ncbi:flagellar hook assembly protein FlgD [Pelomicrobium sp.]|jgi:flagellar basal-body rod modification protein FlgD|uniref:flagellar hook assembly protein FlgD n=1 Tax=Pelomicrobium sp. TaxID=2815319 RepID=UPI002FDE2B34
MPVNAIESVAAAVLAPPSRSVMKEQEDRFLRLLVTQLKNQDPLNPLDNAQITSQMAQISTVQGLERLNATLNALLGQANAAQQLAAASLVGRGVLVPGGELVLESGRTLFGVELKEPADRLTVEIRDATGRLVYRAELGPHGAGIHGLHWDGITESGAVAADGRYSFEVSATRGEQSVAAMALSFGRVDAVARSGDAVSLVLSGGRSAALADVKQVF